MSHPLKLALAAAATASLFATGPPVSSAAPDLERHGAAPVTAVHDDDFRLLSLRLGRLTLADSLEGYSTPGGVCVDLQQLVDALDFPVRVDAAAGTANGWFRNEASTFSLDRARKTIRSAGRTMTFPVGDVLTSPTGLCVDAARAGTWFDMTFRPDLANALLIARSETRLPVELAEERKRRRARARPFVDQSLDAFPRARAPYAMWRTPALDLVADVGAIDDKVRGQNRAFGQYELFASGEAAKMSFDARFASNDQGKPESIRLRAYRKSVDADLLGPMKATAVALGDVTSFGSRLSAENSYGRGAYVSNQPLDRPQAFDRTEFRGTLPAGWDAELHRNGQLIAFADSRADGRYEFLDVPLLFGVNRFEIRLYGPQGQTRRERRTVNVGADSIPAGKTYYWAGFLQDRKDLVTLRNLPRQRRSQALRASAVIERGLGKRTSLSLQLHTLEPVDDKRVTYIEGSLRQIVGPALLQFDLATDFQGGIAFGGQMVAEFGDTYLTLKSLWAHGFISDRVEPGLNSEHSLSLDHFFDIGSQTVPVGVKIGYRDWSGGRADTLDIATRISARLAGLSLTHEVAWQHYSGASGNDQLTTALLVGGRAGRLRLRGEARYRLKPTSELDSVALVAERALDDRSDLRADISYEHLLKRARFGGGYSRRFRRFAFGARAEVGTDGSFGAGLNLAMSFGANGRGKFARVTATKLASAGQVNARVYTDRNRDGAWQQGEPVHPGVTIAAGTAQAEQPTGAAGTTIVDGLRAFRPQLLSLDTSTLGDPLLKPAQKGIVVIPRPGVLAPVDFALLPTGEVEGMLYHGGTAARDALGGATLELVDAAGKVIETTRSDYDGFFLFQSIVYGEYALRLAADTAATLSLSQATLKRVRIDDPAPVVRVGAVILPRAPPLSIAGAFQDDSVTLGGAVVARALP